MLFLDIIVNIIDVFSETECTQKLDIISYGNNNDFRKVSYGISMITSTFQQRCILSGGKVTHNAIFSVIILPNISPANIVAV